MRTIKFRGKYVKTSHWVYGAYHEHIDITPAALYKDAESRENHIKEHTHYLIMQDAFSDYCMPRKIQCFDVTSETIGQFTGLLDKNDTEIYEGDIIEISNNRYKVDWNNKLAAFTAVDSEFNEPYLLTDLNFSKIAVIGNIYDNPSLIQQTRNNGL